MLKTSKICVRKDPKGPFTRYNNICDKIFFFLMQAMVSMGTNGFAHIDN